MVGEQPAPVTFAGLVGPGLYQLNVVVVSDAATQWDYRALDVGLPDGVLWFLDRVVTPSFLSLVARSD
jgi:hypothetical protein